MKPVLLTSLIATLTFGSSVLAGQSRPKPPGTPPAPQQHVYGSLFAIIATLEHDADAADSRGEHGKSQALRKHFQGRIGLNDADASTLRLHATHADQEVRDQDKKAHDLIDKIRKQTPGGKLQAGEKPPAVPQELIDMQSQRDKMINDHVSAIQQSVSADTFQKIDSFARARFEQAKPVRGPQPSGPPRFAKP